MDWLCRLFLLLCICGSTSAAGVMGIDLGAEFLKMAIVKHGASSAVDIVLNEQTQRKTVSYIGFRGEERYFGEDAFQLHTRFPTYMVTYLTRWAGKTFDEAQAEQVQLMFRFNFAKTDRDSVEVQLGDTKHSAEELLAMLLTYVKELVASHAEIPIEDCVIAVPATYTVRQRQILAQAAEIAGLNVYALMHHSVAAGLQYAVSRRGVSEDTNLVVFDMGAAQLEVGVFTLRPPVNASKDIMGHLEVRKIKSAPIGGRHFDALIARTIAEEYRKSSGNDVLAMNTLEGAKATAKLMRTGKRVKETLSANKDALAPVEGIYEERDFITTVTREQFDVLAAPLVDQAIATLKDALASAGLTAADVHICELMGGGTRVPMVQDRLVELLGKPLSKTLNTDEAIAMGTAFQAAKLSGLFRVKTFSIEEPRHMNVTFTLSANETVPKPAHRPLFLTTENATAKTVTAFRSQANYSITIHSTKQDGTVEAIDEFQLVNVSDAFKKLGLFSENVHNESTHRLETRFVWVPTGYVQCDGATARFDEVVNTTKRVKRKPPKSEEATPASASDAAEEEDDDSSSETPAKAEAKPEEGKAESSAAAEGEAGAENTTDANATKNATEDAYDIVNTTTTKRHQQRVTVELKPRLRPWPLTTDDVRAARTLLRTLKERDEAKRRLAQAKNDLETLIYDTKYDKFFDVEELKPFYDKAEEQAIRTLLSETEEWLEGDGYDATLEEYLQRQAGIRKLTDAVVAKQAQEEAKKKGAKDKSKGKKATKKDKKGGKKDDDDDDDDDDAEDDKARRDEL